MTIQSQLDQLEQEMRADRLSAIRAAVGGVGETVAWWREDHVCHAHELTTGDALAGGYKPCVIKCDDCAWNASLCDTHGAVGGEAVAEVVPTDGGGHQIEWYIRADGTRRDPKDRMPSYYVAVTWPVGTKFYASPPATVDVGVMAELVEDWRSRATNMRAGNFVKIRAKADGYADCADELAAIIGDAP